MEYAFTWLLTGAATAVAVLFLDNGMSEGGYGKLALGIIGGLAGGILFSNYVEFLPDTLAGNAGRACAGAGVLLFGAKFFRK